ncbi:MAG: hypothetical protein ABIN48_00930 [Ginsengibacter sp.]
MKEIIPYKTWWQQLQPEWKKAFAFTCLFHSNEPNSEELENLYHSPTLRFAGPSAPFPNMSFELTNLSGVADLHNLEILVVTHHKLETIEELASLKKLKSLFVLNNQIKSLKGIETLTSLEQLYAQENQISSLKSVEKLLKLKEMIINNNKLLSLEGLTEEHAENLNSFYCRPGNHFLQKEILRVENNLGIKCRGN